MLKWMKFSELLPMIHLPAGNVSVDVLVRSATDFMVGYVSYDDGTFHVNAGHEYVECQNCDLDYFIRTDAMWTYIRTELAPTKMYKNVRIDTP